MNHHAQPELDLMPPPFAEGLDDWSRGDGTPDGPTWEAADNARLAREDADFGPCLELRTVGAGRAGALHGRGAAPRRRPSSRWRRGSRRCAGRCRRCASRPGRAARRGRGSAGCRSRRRCCDRRRTAASARSARSSAATPRPGVDLVWDERVLYAHVGLDIVGRGRGGGADRERRGARRHPPLHAGGPGAARASRRPRGA